MAYSFTDFIALYTSAVSTFRPGSQGMHRTPMTAQSNMLNVILLSASAAAHSSSQGVCATYSVLFLDVSYLYSSDFALVDYEVLGQQNGDVLTPFTLTVWNLATGRQVIIQKCMGS